ncbi:MAG TPA: GntR family transcriptional regulator [Virgibacillus sp.]|nr:GntR family transcriptional regulator [Virgibacillus sp.]
MKRSSNQIEDKMIHAIIEGRYPVGSLLDSERELANSFGVGRPTIREVLQGLATSGWITIRKGQPAMVNDYLQDGNIGAIINIVQYFDSIPDEFVLYFLEFRCAISPMYVKKAVQLNHPKVVGLLLQAETLADTAEAYAIYDWELQKELAKLSGNPLFLLTLNSFNDAYVRMATLYFSLSFYRRSSDQYYENLMESALQGNHAEAEEVTRGMMGKSYSLWKEHMSSPDQEEKAGQ